MLDPGMEICALQGAGRQREFTQGLTTSSVGWLLLVHGLCILQIQLLEEAQWASPVNTLISRRTASPVQTGPSTHLWEHRTGAENTPGQQDHTAEAALLCANVSGHQNIA